jgi:hypothetical protein
MIDEEVKVKVKTEATFIHSFVRRIGSFFSLARDKKE